MWIIYLRSEYNRVPCLFVFVEVKINFSGGVDSIFSIISASARRIEWGGKTFVDIPLSGDFLAILIRDWNVDWYAQRVCDWFALRPGIKEGQSCFLCLTSMDSADFFDLLEIGLRISVLILSVFHSIAYEAHPVQCKFVVLVRILYMHEICNWQ